MPSWIRALIALMRGVGGGSNERTRGARDGWGGLVLDARFGWDGMTALCDDTHVLLLRCEMLACWISKARGRQNRMVSLWQPEVE